MRSSFPETEMARREGNIPAISFNKAVRVAIYQNYKRKLGMKFKDKWGKKLIGNDASMGRKQLY